MLSRGSGPRGIVAILDLRVRALGLQLGCEVFFFSSFPPEAAEIHSVQKGRLTRRLAHANPDDPLTLAVEDGHSRQPKQIPFKNHCSSPATLPRQHPFPPSLQHPFLPLLPHRQTHLPCKPANIAPVDEVRYGPAAATPFGSQPPNPSHFISTDAELDP